MCYIQRRTALLTIGVGLISLLRLSSAVGMVVLGTFTTELYATPIRASAMGVFNEAGRLGSIIAPLMLMVGAQVKPADPVYVPFLAFGLLALLAGLLTLVLPETLGAPMAENIDVSGTSLHCSGCQLFTSCDCPCCWLVVCWYWLLQSDSRLQHLGITALHPCRHNI
jgi:MFS family permease